MRVLQKMKAPGKDGIPIELYQKDPFCRKLLFTLVDKMWEYELAPPELLVGVFCPIFKNKGSPEDLTKYRFVYLLSHASKLVSVCLLRRMVAETEWYLPVHQAGFRKERGTRDNIFILAQIMDEMIERGQDMVTVFIDYVAAFDSVSHKFIDDALCRAKASRKSRAMFRAMYDNASAVVRVRKNDGTNEFSAPFPINRGVVQGGIDSPWYFILALEVIFRECDSQGGINLDLPSGNVLRLEYADDAALLCASTQEATLRLTAIAVCSRKIGEADPFWLGATRGTNNTGELNGISTAVLHLQREGGHQPAAICYDSKYAANVTDGTWDAKTNVEAARINRDLYEAEHERRSGGVLMVHVKGHSGDIGNDYADTFVQDGKGSGPFSRIRLARGETQAEKSARHRTLSALALPFELAASA